MLLGIKKAFLGYPIPVDKKEEEMLLKDKEELERRRKSL